MSLAEQIAAAGTIDELLAVVMESDGLQGSDKFYSRDELHDTLERVATGELGISNVTRTEGLRRRTQEVLQNSQRRIGRHEVRK
jgi:hypothetical protein